MRPPLPAPVPRALVGLAAVGALGVGCAASRPEPRGTYSTASQAPASRSGYAEESAVGSPSGGGYRVVEQQSTTTVSSDEAPPSRPPPAPPAQPPEPVAPPPESPARPSPPSPAGAPARSPATSVGGAGGDAVYAPAPTRAQERDREIAGYGAAIANEQARIALALAGLVECREICEASGGICRAATQICRLTGDAGLDAATARDGRCARALTACTEAGQIRDGRCPACPATR